MNYLYTFSSVFLILGSLLIAFRFDDLYGKGLPLLIGLIWLFLLWKREGWGLRKRNSRLSLCFISLSVLALVGMLQKEAPVLAGVGWVFLLVTWDVENFCERLLRAKAVLNPERLLRQHFKRLLSIVALGSLPVIAVLNIHLQIGFWILYLLGAIALIAISSLVHQIIKLKEEK